MRSVYRIGMYAMVGMFSPAYETGYWNRRRKPRDNSKKLARIRRKAENLMVKACTKYLAPHMQARYNRPMRHARPYRARKPV